MFSRALRIPRTAAPLAAASARAAIRRPAAPLAPIAALRSVTTNAASSHVEKSAVPDAEDQPFTVNLSDESFETYELDPPPYTLEVTKKELKQMYYDMVVVRYVLAFPVGSCVTCVHVETYTANTEL